MKKTITILTTVLFFMASYFGAKAQSWKEIAKALPTPAYEQALQEHYGESVDIDGDYAIVGSPYYLNQGRAFVLHYDGSEWKRIAELSSSNIEAYDYFGYAVSISGNTIVIGAYRDNDNGSNSGSVYVFEKPSDGWKDTTETAKLLASDGASGDYFGYAVDISDSTIVVGAYYNDDNGSNSGAAYVFTKPISGWVDTTETAKLLASDGETKDYFGQSVAISNSVIVVGAYNDDDNADNSGAAYVFEKPASGWTDTTETAKLLASDGESETRFGFSLGISNNTIVIGAFLDNDNGSGSGSVYVFEKPTGGWTDTTETAKLLASDGVSYDDFGYAVDILDSTIVVGAYGNDDNGSRSGSVYVFTKPASGWKDTTEVAKLLVSNGKPSDYLGYAVALSGDNIIVGAARKNLNNGVVYIYSKPASGWTDMTENGETTPPTHLGNYQDYFGQSVDIDGDYAVIGSLGYNSFRGTAYVLYFDGSQWAIKAELKPSDTIQQGYFGGSVAISGNTVVVGAYKDSSDGVFSGAAYVFEKPASGWTDMTETAKLMASDASNYDYFGYAVDISKSTIVVGAYNDDDNGSNSGSAYVFTKSASGWQDTTETAKLLPSDGASGDSFGRTLSISNNTIVVGAYADDDNGGSSGSAYVFEKPTSGWKDTIEIAKLLPSDGAGNDCFGYSVDVSESTIVVGAYEDDDNGSNSGSAYVFTKPVSGWKDTTETAKLLASDGANNDFFGFSVAVFDSTIVIGARYDDDKGTNSGSAYVFTKPTDGWTDMTETSKLLASDGVYGDIFGYAVSISEKYILVGAYLNAEKETMAGAAYLFIKPLIQTIDTTICYNASYTFVDSIALDSIIADTSHTSILTTSVGGDSAIIENITVLPQIDITTSLVDSTITTNATGVDYQWLDCNDNMNPIAGEIGQSFTVSNNGNYAVEITQNSCVDTSACVSITIIGIEEEHILNQVNAYPNPAHNKLIISSENQRIDEIEIVDITGKTVFVSTKVNLTQCTIDISSLESGIYFIKINNTKMLKMIKK